MTTSNSAAVMTAEAYAAAATQLWKINLAALADKRKALGDKYKATHMDFLANLICYATTHFVKDGDVNKPLYTEKLARLFQEFLEATVGMDAPGQRNKYSSGITASLFIRKTKADPMMKGLRSVAVAEGPAGVLAFLDNVCSVKSFNQFMAKVSPGSSPDAVDQLVKRVARLPEESRDQFFAKIKAAIKQVEAERAEKDRKTGAKVRTAKVVPIKPVPVAAE